MSAHGRTSNCMREIAPLRAAAVAFLCQTGQTSQPLVSLHHHSVPMLHLVRFTPLYLLPGSNTSWPYWHLPATSPAGPASSVGMWPSPQHTACHHSTTASWRVRAWAGVGLGWGRGGARRRAGPSTGGFLWKRWGQQPLRPAACSTCCW